eukprot:COSAG06_NODE_689_length_13068_cov_9.661269_2_plen_166_part_00
MTFSIKWHFRKKDMAFLLPYQSRDRQTIRRLHRPAGSREASHKAARKHHSVSEFSYGCPEHVSVKRSLYIYKNGSLKKSVFAHRVVFEELQQPAEASRAGSNKRVGLRPLPEQLETFRVVLVAAQPQAIRYADADIGVDGVSGPAQNASLVSVNVSYVCPEPVLV